MSEENYEITVFCSDFEQFFSQFAEQIGRGKIFLEADRILPVNTPVTALFNLVYDDLPFLRASGRVVGGDAPKKGGATGEFVKGMVVELSQTDESIRAFLVDLVKHQLKNELSHLYTT